MDDYPDYDELDDEDSYLVHCGNRINNDFSSDEDIPQSDVDYEQLKNEYYATRKKGIPYNEIKNKVVLIKRKDESNGDNQIKNLQDMKNREKIEMLETKIEQSTSDESNSEDTINKIVEAKNHANTASQEINESISNAHSVDKDSNEKTDNQCNTNIAPVIDWPVPITCKPTTPIDAGIKPKPTPNLTGIKCICTNLQPDCVTVNINIPNALKEIFYTKINNFSLRLGLSVLENLETVSNPEIIERILAIEDYLKSICKHSLKDKELNNRLKKLKNLAGYSVKGKRSLASSSSSSDIANKSGQSKTLQTAIIDLETTLGLSYNIKVNDDDLRSTELKLFHIECLLLGLITIKNVDLKLNTKKRNLCHTKLAKVKNLFGFIDKSVLNNYNDMKKQFILVNLKTLCELIELNQNFNIDIYSCNLPMQILDTIKTNIRGDCIKTISHEEYNEVLTVLEKYNVNVKPIKKEIEALKLVNKAEVHTKALTDRISMMENEIQKLKDQQITISQQSLDYITNILEILDINVDKEYLSTRTHTNEKINEITTELTKIKKKLLSIQENTNCTNSEGTAIESRRENSIKKLVINNILQQLLKKLQLYVKVNVMEDKPEAIKYILFVIDKTLDKRKMDSLKVNCMNNFNFIKQYFGFNPKNTNNGVEKLSMEHIGNIYSQFSCIYKVLETNVGIELFEDSENEILMKCCIWEEEAKRKLRDSQLSKLMVTIRQLKNIFTKNQPRVKLKKYDRFSVVSLVKTSDLTPVLHLTTRQTDIQNFQVKHDLRNFRSKSEKLFLELNFRIIGNIFETTVDNQQLLLFFIKEEIEKMKATQSEKLKCLFALNDLRSLLRLKVLPFNNLIQNLTTDKIAKVYIVARNVENILKIQKELQLYYMTSNEIKKLIQEWTALSHKLPSDERSHVMKCVNFVEYMLGLRMINEEKLLYEEIAPICRFTTSNVNQRSVPTCNKELTLVTRSEVTKLFVNILKVLRLNISENLFLSTYDAQIKLFMVKEYIVYLHDLEGKEKLLSDIEIIKDTLGFPRQNPNNLLSQMSVYYVRELYEKSDILDRYLNTSVCLNIFEDDIHEIFNKIVLWQLEINKLIQTGKTHAAEQDILNYIKHILKIDKRRIDEFENKNTDIVEKILIEKKVTDDHLEIKAQGVISNDEIVQENVEEDLESNSDSWLTADSFIEEMESNCWD